MLIKGKRKVEQTVRKALENGESEFLRPLPGAARMYPETDLVLVNISQEEINEIAKNLPKLKSEHREELGKKGLHEELIKEILSENKLKDFENLIQVYHKPDLVAKMLTIWPKAIKSKLQEKQKTPLILDILETILQNVKQEKIEENDVKQIMEEIAAGKSVQDALKREKVELASIEEDIAKIVREKPGLSINAYMGLVMAHFKGKIDARKAMEILSGLVG
jgi:glutamyl-tRNA(Gln) amidotransferase subunit E